MKCPNQLLLSSAEGRLAQQAEMNSGLHVAQAGPSSPPHPVSVTKYASRRGRGDMSGTDEESCTVGQVLVHLRGPTVQRMDSMQPTTRHTGTCSIQAYFPSEAGLRVLKRHPLTNPRSPFMFKPIWERFPLTTASGIPLSLIREILNVSTINRLIISVSLL